MWQALKQTKEESIENDKATQNTNQRAGFN